jgi:hypothetical protein
VAETAAAPAAPSPGSPGATATQQGQPAAQKGGETPAQAEARRLKLRLGAQEVELDESDVATHYQKGKQAQQVLSKADNARREALKAQAYADGLLQRMKTDPRGVAKELGIDLRKLSEETILQEIELEKMSPAERRAYEAEQKLKGYETEKQKAEEAKKQEAHAAEVERLKDEFAHLFKTTMEATGLPQGSGRFVIHRMAQLFDQNEQAGLESTPEEMAAHVMAGLQAEHRGVLSGLDGDGLLEYLGADVVKKVLGAHLGKVRARRGTPGAPLQAAPAPVVAKPPEGFNPRKGRMGVVEQFIREG